MKRVLLTRPVAQSQEFAAKLRARFGAELEIIESPLLRIEMLAPDVDFAQFDGLVFTSQNGVAAYAHLGGPAGVTAYCVGDRTAAAARDLGLLAVSARGDVAALSGVIAREAPGQRLLHLRGAHIAGQLPPDIEPVIAYAQRPIALSDDARNTLADGKETAVPLFSPRTASAFASHFAGDVRGHFHVVCLSPAVAVRIPAGVFGSLSTCALPTAAAMMAQLDRLLDPRPA